MDFHKDLASIGFKPIRGMVKNIYSEKEYPRMREAGIKGRITDRPDRYTLGSYLYSGTAPCERKVIEQLIELKGQNTWKELKGAYASFAKDLYNNNMANLGSIRRLLKDRLDELETAYFMKTSPIMKFLTHDTIGENIYSLDAHKYLRLCSLLCYMNMLGFEKLLKEMPEVYKVFTSSSIDLRLDVKELVPFLGDEASQFYATDSSRYLPRRISQGKDIVLRYKDINYKFLAINRLLEVGVFDYKITKISKVAPKGIEDEILNGGLKKDYINSTNRFKKPPREKLDDWINQIAKSIIRSGKSDIENPQTIELYLKSLVEYPMSTVGEIREKVLENGKLPKCDNETFSDLSFGAVRGWEKKFFKGLRDRFYVEYAQTFKRYRKSE